jgi:hypothetical protein
MSSTQPCRFVCQHKQDGTIAGVTITNFVIADDGSIRETMPVEFSLDSPGAAEWLTRFGGQAVVELAAARAQLKTLNEEILRLTALIPPPRSPREITPREFLDRISQSDKDAIMDSRDPRCRAAMWTLFTTLSVDLDSPVLSQLIDALIDAGIQIDETERARIFA